MRNFAYYLTVAMATAGALPAHAQIKVPTNQQAGINSGVNSSGLLGGNIQSQGDIGVSVGSNGRAEQQSDANSSTESSGVKAYINQGMNQNVTARGLGVSVDTGVNPNIYKGVNQDLSSGRLRSIDEVKQGINLDEEAKARIHQKTKSKKASEQYQHAASLGVDADAKISDSASTSTSIQNSTNINEAADGDRKLNGRLEQ